LLRSGAAAEADLAHIAEEIEDLGKSWRNALDSRLTQLLLAPAEAPLSAGVSRGAW